MVDTIINALSVDRDLVMRLPGKRTQRGISACPISLILMVRLVMLVLNGTFGDFVTLVHFVELMDACSKYRHPYFLGEE